MQTPELALSVSAQTLLSQRTNKLAELIYAQTQRLQADKGYLSIFRNLTDSYPLADEVLQRLAEQDTYHQATPAGAASNSDPQQLPGTP